MGQKGNACAWIMKIKEGSVEVVVQLLYVHQEHPIKLSVYQ